ncbi:hypothetical protein FHR32_006920 [Streptosporangium album]|uniref:Purine nucleoside phosphorylase n=1 Tax=Streptosporangium album TaxID=47479 RepID=A0A7W7S253_9ACTN|nr:peptidoglycan editing factor PgeF [Streptosporangium album]MBB4942534.1 hypothetical protein [Streptosporangium album]
MNVQTRITDRHGGVSAGPYGSRNLGAGSGDDLEAVATNRAMTAAEFGLDRVVFMRQVHSADVRYVSEPFGDDPPPLDGIFTDVPGLGLAALCADCAPVLLADPRAGLVGAAHSGRAGTVLGVVPALVAEMAAHGAEPADMTALIGPMACGTCYEVPAEMRGEVAAVLPEAWSITRQDTPALDLRAAITSQLAKAGVGEVTHDTRCTMETPGLFSHRRDRTTGRFAGYVWLEA